MKQLICTLGTQDIPIIQDQPPFRVDLLETNVLLFGSAMSGKSNFLKLLITILHKTCTTKNEQIFVLDFGGALHQYENLPLVSAYFDNSNEEYVKRVFKLMEEQLRSNVKALSGSNYRSCENANFPHTTLIIDNINLFLDEPRYIAYHESLHRLCRDGLSKGITIVATASSTKGLGSLMNSFKQKIALEMPAESYSDIFGHRTLSVGTDSGRGVANVTVDPEIGNGTFQKQRAYEVLLNEADDFDDTMENAKQKFKDDTVKKYIRFPSELTAEEYQKIAGKLPEASSYNNCVPIGLDYTACEPVLIDLKTNRCIAVYGKKQGANLDLLDRLIKDKLDNTNDYEFVFLDDGRKELEKYNTDANNVIYINGSEEKTFQGIRFPDGIRDMSVSLNSLQRLIYHIHENYIDLKNIKNLARGSESVLKCVMEMVTQIAPTKSTEKNKTTVFVLHAKQLYVESRVSENLLDYVLPMLKSMAEELNMIFIYSDVKFINDSTSNTAFNSMIDVAFLFDNISEFVNDRGRKSVFGNMDAKALKEEYARCEDGDGFYFCVEEDDLKKVKFVK